MKYLKNMKTGSMLGLGFSVLILIALSIALLGRARLIQASDDVSYLADTRITSLLRLVEVKRSVEFIFRGVRSLHEGEREECGKKEGTNGFHRGTGNRVFTEA